MKGIAQGKFEERMRPHSRIVGDVHRDRGVRVNRDKGYFVEIDGKASG